MNRGHLEFLASPEWGRLLEEDLLPWLSQAGPLGDDVLEVGPGPGLTTDLLRRLGPRLTTLEADPDLATALGERLAGSGVEVRHGDATATDFTADRFSAVTCFSVLHHLPSPREQDRLFAEVARVLRPGGVFLGVDALDLEPIREGHVDDTFVPVDPATLGRRLERAGLSEPEVELQDYQFRFRASKSAR